MHACFPQQLILLIVLSTLKLSINILYAYVLMYMLVTASICLENRPSRPLLRHQIVIHAKLVYIHRYAHCQVRHVYSMYTNSNPTFKCTLNEHSHCILARIYSHNCNQILHDIQSRIIIHLSIQHKHTSTHTRSRHSALNLRIILSENMNVHNAQPMQQFRLDKRNTYRLYKIHNTD